MSALAITGRCVVLPRKSGTRLVMPPGFKTGESYEVQSGFFPNGSRDLHLYVVGELGKIYPLIATGVKMTGSGTRCIVLPRKAGATRTIMPPGFKTGVTYVVLTDFFPNGSRDLHFYVIGEGGMIYPLIASDVKIIGSARQVFDFPDAANPWVVTGVGSNGWAETCLDTQGRKMLPHRVTWDATYQSVVIDWTRPVAGHFLLG